MRLLAPLLITLIATTALAEDGIELTDPKTGAVITVPADWEFAAAEDAMMAIAPRREAMLLLAEVGSDFEEEALRVEEVLDRHLADVTVERAEILLAADRGALRGAVAAVGTGVSRRDDRPVAFYALLAKDSEGDAGLVLAAWKEDHHADTLRAIVDSVRFSEPGLVRGLALRDTRTGAAVELPQGWSAYRSRHGVVAMEPNRQAMAIMMAPKRDYNETVRAVRLILGTLVFKDVEVGEFTRVAGITKAGITDVMEATGTAKTREDDAPVEFVVIAGREMENDRGFLVIGAWKDPAFKEPLGKMLRTIHLPED
ncbi:MAG: hypothetical protein ACYTGR_16430 [Planctomycetota bacterium]|jgi:hypothetical protein